MKSFKFESKWIQFSAMGLELGLSVIVGLLVGEFLDKQFGTEPWLLLLFLIFGLAAGFRSVYRLLKRLQKNNDASSIPR
ncbi:MAG: AtpZ/AtpI family protein [SAR324 cluster bacterium]|nr:AtpZ/AtpI family protein [SAR324 cluster bacterium]